MYYGEHEYVYIAYIDFVKVYKRAVMASLISHFLLLNIRFRV